MHGTLGGVGSGSGQGVLCRLKRQGAEKPPQHFTPDLYYHFYSNCYIALQLLLQLLVIRKILPEKRKDPAKPHKTETFLPTQKQNDIIIIIVTINLLNR